MSQLNITIEDVKKAMTDPAVKNARPEEMINNLRNLLGLGDLEPVDATATEEVVKTYFQAFKLEHDNWAFMGPGSYIQTVPFKLRKLPPGTKLIADVLIDQTDFEAECFDRFIRTMDVRGKTIVFDASAEIPVNLTIGLKCVDAYGAPVIPEDEYFWKSRK